MISVIVPIYNVEAYLSECIDSILRQSYHDFELLLVDDGSPDSSGKICDEYALRDSRIRVIHQENGGVTSARKAGVQAAKGEWICFVDGDDTIPTDSIKILASSTSEMTDIIVARCDNRVLPKEMSLDEYRRCCITGRKVHSGPTARAYRTSLFSSYTFDIPREIRIGEDWLMNIRLAFTTNKAPVLVDKKVYNYRSNESSVMHTFVRTIENTEQRLEYLCKSIPSEYADSFRYEYNYTVWKQLAHMVYDNPQDYSWKSSTMYLYLENEIREGRFQMTLSQRLELLPRNMLQLRIIIKLIKIIEWFNNKIGK